MGKTLSIETGIQCNNRCTFCYQRSWRAEGGFKDPTLDEISAKLRWGIDNGHDAVGFSGGEPTLRRDIVEIVSQAVELGYRRVSLTTNGRRLSNRDFAARLIAAGVDSIGWSLHGPDAATHDSLVGRDGAFVQVVAGMRNVAAIARGLDRRIDQNLFILVNRHNVDQVAKTCSLGRSLGIKLMILQPVVFSKGNLSLAAEHSVPLSELVAAVRRAAQEGLRHEWFVKLFNLPACFFTEVLEAFEHQRYPVNIFRHQERERAGETRLVAGQGYVRLDRCGECVLQSHCPGLHQSLVPQDSLLELAKGSLQAAGDGEEIWLSGTELMTADTLTRFVAFARGRSGSARMRLFSGGDSVAGDGLAEAAVRGGVTRLGLVHSGISNDTHELSALSGGNALQLASLAEQARGHGLELSLVLPYVAEWDESQCALLERFAARGLSGLEIHLPPGFKNPEVFELFKVARMAAVWRGAGGLRTEVVLADRQRRGTLFFRGPLPLVAGLSVGPDHLAKHFFSGPLAGWISSSTPPFARIPGGSGAAEAQPSLSGLPGAPVDEAALERMRPG